MITGCEVSSAACDTHPTLHSIVSGSTYVVGTYVHQFLYFQYACRSVLVLFQWSFCSPWQVGETGCVVGIEHIKELNDQAIVNVDKDNPKLLKSDRVKLVGKRVL